jgi:hypothetical protein
MYSIHCFFPQKEYDIYSLFPHLNSGKYDIFVDVFFSTGNFYFFLNLPNNLLNIPNLSVYAFYQSIKKGNSKKILDYVFFVPAVDIKDKYNHCKKELNQLLLKYEQDTTNDEVELEVAQNYYFLTKGSNKQTVKFKNKEGVSLFNHYVTKVEPDKELKYSYTISHITKNNILYCFDYEDILNKCDGKNVIIFIDIMQQIINYYEKLNFDQQMFYKFFISAKALVLMAIPNNYTFRILFREYIVDITRYMEDDNDEKTTVKSGEISQKDN